MEDHQQYVHKDNDASYNEEMPLPIYMRMMGVNSLNCQVNCCFLKLGLHSMQSKKSTHSPGVSKHKLNHKVNVMRVLNNNR